METGKVIVLGYADTRLRQYRNDKGQRMAICLCHCGKEFEADYQRARKGVIKSCGCHKPIKLNIDIPKYKRRAPRGSKDSKGMHRLYYVRANMICRCYDTSHSKYRHYGGRGITICDEWLKDVDCFIDWGIKNGWQPGLQIDRERVNGNYEPSNCRFVTRKVNNNNKRNNVFIEHDGVSKTISQWADYFNVPYYIADSCVNNKNINIEEMAKKYHNKKQIKLDNAQTANKITPNNTC